MKNTRTVVASAVSRLAAQLSGATSDTSPPTITAQTKSPELPNGRERKDEWPDRPGTSLVFTFFIEGFATYGALMHGVSVEAVLIAARRAQPRSASRTPIAAVHEHGSDIRERQCRRT
jgi:hypothetical protein